MKLEDLKIEQLKYNDFVMQTNIHSDTSLHFCESVRPEGLEDLKLEDLKIETPNTMMLPH